MASIWIDEVGRPTRKLAGRLDAMAAMVMYSEIAREWPYRKHRDGLHTLLWREDSERPFALIVLELHSPPSKADKGERRRSRSPAAGKGRR